jgi:hypothetical protein
MEYKNSNYKETIEILYSNSREDDDHVVLSVPAVEAMHPSPCAYEGQ